MIVFLLLCAAFGHLTRAQLCSGAIPPGLDKLRKGVDITNLDILPLDVGEQEGFRGVVIDYLCADRKTWTNPTNNVSEILFILSNSNYAVTLGVDLETSPT